MATKLNLLVLASADSPELKVLDRIKGEVQIVGVGATLAQLQNMPEDAWATVDVVLAAGAPSSSILYLNSILGQPSQQGALVVGPSTEGVPEQEWELVR